MSNSSEFFSKKM